AVGVHAAGVGVAARQVLLAQEHQQLAPALVGGGGDFRDRLVAEGFAVVLDADGLVADLVFGDFVGDGLEARGPLAEVAEVFAGQRLYGVVVALAQGQESAVPLAHQVVAAVEVQGLGELVVAELVQGLPEGLGAGGGFGLLFNARVERAALLGDLGQVADAGAGDEAGGAGFAQAGVDAGIEVAARTCSCRLRGYSRPYSRFAEDFFAQQSAQVGEHPAHAGDVELAGDRRIHRHVFVGRLERDAVALPLLADVTQGVFGAALVVLVEHDQLGVVDHVDLLELAGGAVVAGHDV